MIRQELLSFSNDVKKILADLEAIKTAQLLGGDSWIFYRLVTGNNPDYSMSGMNTNDVRVFRITFTPDDPTIITTANFQLIETWTVGHRSQLIPVQGADHSWDIRYTANANGFSLSAIILVSSTQTGTISVQQVA